MKVGFATSVMTAVLLAAALKGLAYFQMISWQPVSFLKKSMMWGNSSAWVHWGIFIMILFLLALLLFVLSQFLYFMPVGFTSLMIGIIMAVLLEWQIINLPTELSSFKKLSIPFIVVVTGFTHFIVYTAIYHKQAKNREGQNQLPYGSSMVK